MTVMTPTARPSAPSLETITRLIEQSIQEQRDTRERLDAHIDVTSMRLSGLEGMIDAVRTTGNAQFLMLAGQLKDTQKHVERIEDHVGLLTTKVVEHDQRFDAIDRRLDTIDQRLDTIDTRLDAHDKRFDSVDKRFDSHDKRFDSVDGQLRTIAEGVAELRRASAPPA